MELQVSKRTTATVRVLSPQPITVGAMRRFIESLPDEVPDHASFSAGTTGPSTMWKLLISWEETS